MARLAMCGVVGGAAAWGLFVLAAPTDSQSALLEALSPQVTLSRDGGAQDVNLELVVRSGDTVRTDERGRALITYPDGSTAILDGSSELTIEFVRTSAGDYLVRMEQTIGRVWYAAARTIGSGGRYEVHSAAMASVIRAGSGFYVAVGEDGATTISATTGTVAATAGGATVTLPAGTSTTIGSPGQTPAPPQFAGTSPQVSAPSPTVTETPTFAVTAPTEPAPEEKTKGSSSSGSTVSAPVTAQPSTVDQPAAAPGAAPHEKAAPAPILYTPTSLVTVEPADKATTTDKVVTAETTTPTDKVTATDRATTAAKEIPTSEKATSAKESSAPTRSTDASSATRSTEPGATSRDAGQTDSSSDKCAQPTGRETVAAAKP